MNDPRPDGVGDPLRFASELFDARADALEHLADHDVHWFGDFGSIDPLHDVYGLEVCGIRDERDAQRIRALLRELFPRWRHDAVVYKDRGADPGWKVKVHRDDEPDREPYAGA